jgi:hypothetical protein
LDLDRHEEEPMPRRLAIKLRGMLVSLLTGALVVSCIGGPISGSAACAAPTLGLVTDDRLQVIEVMPGSAAEQAGVEAGDVLLDLTWIPSDEPMQLCNDVIYVDASGSPLPEPPNVVQPAVKDRIEHATVPFTARERIRGLTDYSVPLSLRVQRNGQVMTLTIVPRVYHGDRPTPPLPTRTPVPPSYGSF